ncbi:protein FAM83G [Hoplias malabaricus]|uniref:protein FAM83G n=1 Tax=Hoplias malabaricus TaxID=27720 RepID=UPI0034625853
MAESQLLCLDDDHVNVKVPESRPEFYYSEEQRAALEKLLRQGDGAFKMRLREDNIKDFLSAREVRWVRETFQEYDSLGDPPSETPGSPSAPEPSADSGVHSTYWPSLSDTEVPPLDIGWTNTGFYRGVTRVSVYSHPPKEKSPHIKEVVRKLIQESHKVVAVVMDLLTDLLILQDLLDAASKRGVAIYLLLEEQGLPHFLDMCSRLQISAQHLRSLRVRTVRGSGLALSFGRIPGCLCSKYMLVDGEKVMFGSYSFTWTSSRINRNTITVMSGQVVDFFDNDFRELYAVSDKVDLYQEFHITKPPMATPLIKTPVAPSQPPLSVSSSRFQVSLDDSKKVNLKVPAHKYHNPKYALVVGNSLGLTGSLQDLSKLKDHIGENNIEKLLHTSGDSKEPMDNKPPQSPVSPKTEENKTDVKNPSPFGLKKQRSSFRLFLKGRSPNHSPDLKTVNSNVSKAANPSSPKAVNHSKDLRTDNTNTDSKAVNPSSPKAANPSKDLINKSIEASRLKEDNNSKVPSNITKGVSQKMTKNATEVNSNIANNVKEVPPKMTKEAPQRTATQAKEILPGTANNKGVPPRIANHAKEVSPNIPSHAKEVSPTVASPAKEVSPRVSNHAKEVSPILANHSKESNPKETSEPLPSASPLREESDSLTELDDTFVIIEKPHLLKYKSKKSKLGQRSLSLQTISAGEEDGSRGRRRNQKKTCIQS